jgi:hypothetical protein
MYKSMRSRALPIRSIEPDNLTTFVSSPQVGPRNWVRQRIDSRVETRQLLHAHHALAAVDGEPLGA